jgi:hypothetical protein
MQKTGMARFIVTLWTCQVSSRMKEQPHDQIVAEHALIVVLAKIAKSNLARDVNIPCM